MPKGVREKRKDPAGRPAVERGIPVAIVDVLLDNLGVDEAEITFDSKLCDDLGADSLDVVEIQMALEAEYRLMLDDEIAERWADGGTIQTIVSDLRAAGAKV